MKIIHDIRTYFRNNSLKSKLLAQSKQQRKRINFEEAQTVGLIFDATDTDKRQTALGYAEKLSKLGKKVKLLGFFDSKQDSADFSFGYFNRKNIDWALRPNGKSVETFLQGAYDILITLNPLTNQHVEYISALANAHLKIGPDTNNTYCYDLMIDVRNKNSVMDFIREMEQLLTKTNIKHGANKV
jgi:hypothetical protein